MTEVPGGRWPVAILGAGGYIGQTFLARLADHPQFEPTVLVGGARTAGRTVGELWQLAEAPPAGFVDRRLDALGPAALARTGVRIAFSGLPSGTAGPVERELARRGVAVFSNAADLRGARGVPLLIPEVNPQHLRLLDRRPRGSAPIVTNPNCSATGLAIALAPIVPLLRPRAVHVATYQSLSGAGFPGVASLSIHDNVVPFIENEERKLAEETLRLLDPRADPDAARRPPFTLLAHCARVATREGHLEAVTVEARRRPDRSAIERAWRSFDPLAGRPIPSAPHPTIVLRTEPDRPQPLRDRFNGSPASARGMAVTVGRVRWEPPFLRFFLLVPNTVRGGAGGSIENAELARSEGDLGP